MAYNQTKKKRKSFSDAIRNDPNTFDRFIEAIFKYDTSNTIKNLADFKDHVYGYMNSDRGSNAKIDDEDILFLFEHDDTRERMKQNVTPKELDQLYGDGILVQRDAITKHRIITVSEEKIRPKGYIRNGRTVTYVRGKGKKFTPVQTKFLQVRKQKKVKPKQAYIEYNEAFPQSPRTEKSISSKYYKM